MSHWLPPMLALLLAPLFMGVINRTKAFFAGRHGQPLLQSYFDLAKLLNKGAVYSTTTSWVFRMGPVAQLAAVLVALLMVPFGGQAAPLAFAGDLVVVAGLLATMRFWMVLAALDTGSAFAGMGASREVQLAVLAEPALFLGLAVAAHQTHSLSLSDLHSRLSLPLWSQAAPVLLLAATCLFVVFLAENARIPVDDPNTHLELTMIHEAMILDHSGPDLAFLEMAAALKHWILASLVVALVIPAPVDHPLLNLLFGVLAMLGLAIGVGVLESSMSRMRLLRVPKILVGASVMAILAFLMGRPS